MRNPREVVDGVVYLRTMLVNVYIIREGASWVLVDTGLGGYARTIREVASVYVGSDKPPAAIVLTHGHFDHVGSLEELLTQWKVPVFAHRLERPYLTGRSPYPPPDPLVGGGSMALLSRLYPRGPVDIGECYCELPDDGLVPGLPGWRWIATPGHTAGHVSLFRERNRVMIAGDAVVTTKQESALAVATQRPELHGPPAYFTQDWQASRDSVQRIAAFEPDVLAAGHGEPMTGPAMRRDLLALGALFDQTELPSAGRYAKQPAVTDENGIVLLPPDPLPRVLAGAAIAAAVAWGISAQTRQRPV
jgi:glyoxylase-like metal-dependent hydrolase (beta-lactamase superfamily II)